MLNQRLFATAPMNGFRVRWSRGSTTRRPARLLWSCSVSIINDLTGHLLEKSGEWTVLNLAAIAEADEQIPISDGNFHLRRAGEPLHPDYESLETLERIRRELGSDIFSAQYQQSPVPPGGAMIKRVWLRYYDKPRSAPTGPR